jgi:predicted metal-dependent hydrolase
MQLTLPLVGFEDGDAAVDGAAPPPAPRAGPPPAAAPPETDPRAPVDRVEFVRTPRARRYILRIRPDGSLRVTVPRWGSQRAARDFVARQRGWIVRQRERLLRQQTCRDWRDGSEIWLRGERVRVAVAGAADRLTISYGDRCVEMPKGGDIRAAIELDLRRLAQQVLEPRLRELAASHGLQPGRVSIRNQRSRWGSCARAGNIALNFRLVQMPPAVRDYVLVHELMHLPQQNHSPRFWRLVEQACPTFKEAERWLRSEGKALL